MPLDRNASPYLLAPEQGESFWQPEPANGYVTVKVSPWSAPGIPFSQGIQVIPPGSKVRKHSHENQNEVIFCLEGKGRAEVDGKAFPMESGTVIVLRPHMEHSFINDGVSDLKFIWTISGTGLEDFFRAIGKPRQPQESVPPRFDRPSAEGLDDNYEMST